MSFLASVLNIFSIDIFPTNFTGFLECHSHDFSDSLVHVARIALKEAKEVGNFSWHDRKVIELITEEAQSLINLFPGFTHCFDLVTIDNIEVLGGSMCEWKTPYDQDIFKRSFNQLSTGAQHCFKWGTIDKLQTIGDTICHPHSTVEHNLQNSKDIPASFTIEKKEDGIQFDTANYIQIAIPLLMTMISLTILIYKKNQKKFQPQVSNS